MPAWAALALALGGCALHPQQPAGRAPTVKPKTPPGPHAQREYHVLAGEMALQRGDLQAAARQYVAALGQSTGVDVAKRATQIALFANQPELAAQAASAWVKTAPNSAAAHKAAARTALRNDDVDALNGYASWILHNSAGNPGSGLVELMAVLGGAPRHADTALAVMQTQVSKQPELARAHYILGLLAYHYGKTDLAAAATDQALVLQPHWPKAVLLKAGVLASEDRVKQATRLVADLEGSLQQRVEYQLDFARMLMQAGQNAAAKQAFQHALALQPDNTGARFGYGLLLLSTHALDAAKKQFNTLYTAHQRRDDAAYYLGAIAAQQTNYSTARTWFQRVKKGRHVGRARLQSARMLYKQGDLTAARDELALLRSTYPGLRNKAYSLEAALLYNAGDYSKALHLYDSALATAPENPDFLYGRALVYEATGKVDSAEQQLRDILKIHPDDARVLNALGYMLTNHSRDYAQALGYIRRALEQHPGDAAIIDSLGWVQYKLGHLHKAKQLLQKAHDKMPNPEIAAHLGEVLWTLGEHNAAQAVWRRALSAHPDAKTLDATIKRLNP